jgi:hypothetical protein
MCTYISATSAASIIRVEEVHVLIPILMTPGLFIDILLKADINAPSVPINIETRLWVGRPRNRCSVLGMGKRFSLVNSRDFFHGGKAGTIQF